MRRFLFGMVIASMTMATPGLVLGGDRDIAQAIMTRLEQQKAEGRLKGFDIDLEVKQSVVYLRGSVSTTQQLADVEAAAKQATGVTNVVNELKVSGEEAKAPGFSLKEALKAARPGTDSAVKPAAAVDTAAPALSDEQVTDAIIEQLQIEKKAGNLRGFQLDVRTVNGETWVGGRVANQAQRDLVLGIVKNTKGVKNILDEVSVNEPAVVAAANTELAPVAPVAPAVPSSIPVMGGQAVPQAYAPSMLTAAQVGGAPVPMQSGAPVPYGAGVPRYDQPYMPSYAWPSYAAYPNYAAVTYPKQYSPSAWPYIGPFYPYPQVPLGWRKVTLEWDDGLWYLDFQSK